VEQPCPSAVGIGPGGLFQSRFLRYNLILKQLESKIKTQIIEGHKNENSKSEFFSSLVLCSPSDGELFPP
jgi:hypothetical protein